MTGKTRYVQPIALLRAGTHEDAVQAAALASVAAYVNTPDEPAWKEWLASHFAKSVRRARPGPFTEAETLAAATASVGDARAAAFTPTTYDNMAPVLTKMQVEGTELPRAGWKPVARTPHAPLMLINEGVDMSTGKTSAQAAHGLFVWYLSLSAPARQTWVQAGMPFDLTGVPGGTFAKAAATTPFTIEDSGFTEIDPDTMTVAVICGDHVA